MAALTVKLEGVDELQRALKRLPVSLRKKHLRRATRQGIALIRNDIKATAPQRPSSPRFKDRPKPGRLKRLIRILPRRPRRGYLKISLFYPVLRELGTTNDPKNAFYWRFVEFGTKHQPANPFVQRAADRNFRRVLTKVIAETNRGVRGELAKLRTRA